MMTERFELRKDAVDPNGPTALAVKLHMPYAHLAERVAWALKHACAGRVDVEVVQERPAGKKASVTLHSIKDPDGWGDLISSLELSDYVMKRHFEFGEYANLEIEVEVVGDELMVTGGRIVPR
jgi:hypothetical protein